MKLRFFVITAVLLSFSYAAPWSFSQDQGSPSPSASGTSTQTDKTPAQTDKTAATTPTVSPADPDKVKHDGGKNDVDAIGNRKMGGRGMGNWYSIESEIRMGKEYAQQVEASVKLIQDPVITEYVNRVGQNLVRNSDSQVPFTIKVIDSDEINAMALPGGFFYVNSGLILRADEEAELAGVMGHEIAHVAARHGTKTATKGEIVQLASIPAMIFIPYGWAGYAAYQGANFLIPMTFFTFSRDIEREAYFLGLQYMYKAGYDPNSYVT